ncbi:MAG: ChbG/HpnK family deacetylase [Desulfobacterales bacterium]|nr:ChbG/HpnK family deacetylase [Desulfobacterales bacterium]
MRSILVINGDDAGADRRGDQDLLKLARLGVMGAASVLVNGPWAAHFISWAQKLNLSLGLHFNLSHGRPTGGPYKTLTDPRGRFFSPKQQVWEKAAAGRFDPDEVAEEATAQWQFLLDAGAAPDHLDGHNHIQVFENVFQGLARAFKDRKGLFFRIPEEPECPADYLPGMPAPRKDGRLIRKQAPENWRFADRFVGCMFGTLPTGEGISHLADIQPGLTEWMVHPNTRPGSPFTTDINRRRELDYLCRKSTHRRIARWGYELGSFKGNA